jgi:hypothetical protein
MEQYWDTALNNIRKARARVASRYNAVRRQVEYKEGDFVLLRLHPLSSKSLERSAKLNLKWSTQFRIVKFVSPVTVLLANADRGVIVRRAYVSQLKQGFKAD